MEPNDKSLETVSDELATSELSEEAIDEVSGGGKGKAVVKAAKAVGRQARDAAAWLGVESLFD